MTGVRPALEGVEQLRESIREKENPDDWYLLTGEMVAEFSVHDAEVPEFYEESEEDLPPEDQDANENVEGFYQVGSQGWGRAAFVDDCDFVKQVGFGGDEIDRLAPMLLVHESKLSEEALEHAHGKKEAPADD